MRLLVGQKFYIMLSVRAVIRSCNTNNACTWTLWRSTVVLSKRNFQLCAKSAYLSALCDKNQRVFNSTTQALTRLLSHRRSLRTERSLSTAHWRLKKDPGDSYTATLPPADGPAATFETKDKKQMIFSPATVQVSST